MMTHKRNITPSTLNAGDATARRSENGLLITLLRITRWVLAFSALTFILSLFGAPYFPIEFGGDPTDPNAELPTFFIGAAFEPNSTPAGMIAQSFAGLISIGFGLILVHQLLRILANVESGNAFARDNGRRLRVVGACGAVAQLAIYLVWAVAHIVGLSGLATVEGVYAEITPIPWIAILGVFALSRVFAEGTSLKEEQDLTVSRIAYTPESDQRGA